MFIKKYNLFLLVAMASLLFFACEDVVQIEEEAAETLIVVDAFVTNQSEKQTIRLTTTRPFFDSLFTPVIDDAKVILSSSSGASFEFVYESDGNYTWQPNDGQTIGNIGDEFQLDIEVDGKSLRAFSSLNRVPFIDELRQIERLDDIRPDGIYMQFIARDFEGIGDSYWIKTFKNGMYLNKPEEINIAYDAGFSPGSEVDGLIFIPPIRELVNPVADTIDFDTSPWEIGDHIRVEIHSISNEAFLWMESARDQLLNANNTIFAEPFFNTKGNIKNLTDDQEVIGVFTVSAVSAMEGVVE